MRLAWPIEPQVHIPRHFIKAQDLAGSEELLRRAAECLADTRPHDSGVRPAASGDDEIDALIWFAWESDRDVDVFDLHNNNVIQDSSGRMNPIDAHFFFPNRATRINALRKLGLIGAAADADVEGFEK